MHKFQGMQKRHRVKELTRILLHKPNRERPVVVLPQEIKQAQTALLEDHADVASVVEPSLHFDAVELSIWVVLLHRLQHVNLNLRRVPIFLNVANDLDGAVASELPIPALKHPSESAFPERCQDFVHGRDAFAELVLQVSVLWRLRQRVKIKSATDLARGAAQASGSSVHGAGGRSPYHQVVEVVTGALCLPHFCLRWFSTSFPGPRP